MKRKISAIVVTLGLALTLAACGDSTEDATPAGSAATSASTSSSDVDAAHNDADTEFAQMMIVHHQGAIEMADLAVEKAESEEVRSLAEGISAAQGPEIDQMTSWLEAWGEETSPMGGHDGMDHGGMDMNGMSQDAAMGHLGGQSGTEFDNNFLELMIAHHEGAVEMAQTELDNGENAEALELARKIIDDQEAEIAEMESLLQNI
ncbi:DUF305 domain-containing protein [Georgenia yuyongxinii]|uniref:DUF305 domain-containing protein n=1 Tax=Georgenia yuyongxinii TaxID=2589797 RepID=A0A552WSG3_9MICO|nr:DUF305 domain-containing protein [Georgenia yuyongxinii]TRW45742.1 DUF305 domain-containing protein [Georgenia yuyongxinii]